MRAFILILLLCCVARADSVSNDNPKVFESAAELHKWATSTWTGASMTELTYKKHKLVVYFLSYTSGVATSEPFVFMEQDGRWVRVLTALMCQCAMEATIEGDALVLWRLDYPKGKGPSLTSPGQPTKTEYLRFNLKTLDAG